MSVSTVVFDCDGVIIDSVAVKTLAFGKIVEQHGPKAVARMTAYHQEHGGVCRYRKFEWFYREVLGCVVTENELQNLDRKFRMLVFDGIMEAPLIPGILQVLETLDGRLPMYVASGTPRDELWQLLEARNLTRFFKGVYGAPQEKAELLRIIIAQEGISAASALMVGDSSTDLNAANTCGMHFYGIGAAFASTCWPSGRDCTDLARWVLNKVT